MSSIMLDNAVPTLLNAIINQPEPASVVSQSIKDSYGGEKYKTAIKPVLDSLRRRNIHRLLEGIETGFKDFDFAGLDKHTDTGLQGSYTGVCIKRNALEGLYNGSSWGHLGAGHRIGCHKNKAWREKHEPNKWFYKMMNDPEVTTHFVMTALFVDPTERDVVMLSEGLSACLLSGFDSATYRGARSLIQGLPSMHKRYSLNQADPLGSCEDEDAWIAPAVARNERLRDGLLEGKSRFISLNSDGSGYFCVGRAHFRVKPQHTKALHVGKDDQWCHVQFEVPDGRHPHCWSPKSGITEAGQRLGIRMSKIIDGREVVGWQTRLGDFEEGKRLANALVDWLAGDVPNLYKHTWPSDRRAFIGTIDQTDSQYTKKQRKRKQEALESFQNESDEDGDQAKTKKPRKDLTCSPEEEMGRKIAELKLVDNVKALEPKMVIRDNIPGKPDTVIVHCNNCKLPETQWIDGKPRWFVVTGEFIIRTSDGMACTSKKCQTRNKASRSWSPSDPSVMRVSYTKVQQYVREARKVTLE